MADTLQADENNAGPVLSPGELARKLGELLAEHNAGEVAILDLAGLNSWTDFFVIATVTSRTHAQGLIKSIRDFSRENGALILHSRRKAQADDEWNLLDFGSVILHLMSAKARSFYELERLWTQL
jgi:ribosome-associated protein